MFDKEPLRFADGLVGDVLLNFWTAVSLTSYDYDGEWSEDQATDGGPGYWLCYREFFHLQSKAGTIFFIILWIIQEVR
jgi:hypothetical protein